MDGIVSVAVAAPDVGVPVLGPFAVPGPVIRVRSTFHGPKRPAPFDDDPRSSSGMRANRTRLAGIVALIGLAYAAYRRRDGPDDPETVPIPVTDASSG